MYGRGVIAHCVSTWPLVPSAGYAVVKPQALQAFTDCHCGSINRSKYTNKTHLDCGNDCVPVSFPRDTRHLFFFYRGGRTFTENLSIFIFN